MVAMAGLLRIERAGGWYHVTSRGNERKAIFKNDRDRWHFLELLEELVEVYRVRWEAIAKPTNGNRDRHLDS
jgi:REP-associated tyrosine transposase